jgi:hypothetical protein
MRFTKKMPNNIITASKILMYVFNDTKTFKFNFFAFEYQKFTEFYADFKFVEIIEKSASRKSYLPIAFASLSIVEDRLQLCILFCQ